MTRPHAFSGRLIAVAASAVCGLAHAQVQIYGTVDLAVGQIETQPPGAPNAPIITVKGVHSGGLQTSYWGIRGSEDLGGGWRARFQLESFMRVDIGTNGRFDASPTSGADFFWSREAFVAFGGGFGELRLGNNGNPAWVAMIQSSALGANSVFSPGFRQVFNGGTRGRSEADTALGNSVKYQSPVVGGVSGSVAVQAGEGSGTGPNYAFNIGYRGGPVFVTAAAQRIRHAALPNLAGARDQDIVLVGASYDVGAVKLFGQYTTIDNDRLGSKDKISHVGLAVPLGVGSIQLAHSADRNSTATTSFTRKTTSGGYVHALSKRTELYTFLMRDKVSSGTAESFVVGIRHLF